MKLTKQDRKEIAKEVAQMRKAIEATGVSPSIVELTLAKAMAELHYQVQHSSTLNPQEHATTF